MKDISTAFPSLPPTTQSDQIVITKKRQYGELTGLSKQIAEKASESPANFEMVKTVLIQQLAYLREDDEIDDPVHVKGKGRPRVKRLKSFIEQGNRRNSLKCGKCGREGHNARSCKHKTNFM
jgi:hypothetical protein